MLISVVRFENKNNTYVKVKYLLQKTPHLSASHVDQSEYSNLSKPKFPPICYKYNEKQNKDFNYFHLSYMSFTSLKLFRSVDRKENVCDNDEYF